MGILERKPKRQTHDSFSFVYLALICCKSHCLWYIEHEANTESLLPIFNMSWLSKYILLSFFPPSLYWAMHSKQTCIQNGILYRLTWSGRRLSLKQKKKRFTFAAHTVLSTEWFLASITQKTWIVCKKGPTANTYTTNDFAESVSDPLIPPGGEKRPIWIRIRIYQLMITLTPAQIDLFTDKSWLLHSSQWWRQQVRKALKTNQKNPQYVTYNDE